MNGFVNVNKKFGDGSTFVVGKVKKKLSSKCGHMGTLDPLASGVLPVGISKATRLFDYLLDKRKTYIAEFEFGRLTDTLDCEGTDVYTGGRVPTKEEITCVLGDFVGEIDQVPPRFSAKMVAGKRGYELARRGVAFELPPKRVTIDGVECIGQTAENKYTFRIDCRGGTYIRSLARDIANKLGTYGTMTALQRTAAGVFTLENSVSLEEFMGSDNPWQYVLPTDEAISFPKIKLSEVHSVRLLNGLFDRVDCPDGLYRVYAVDTFWGVGEVENGLLKMRAYCREC